MDYLAQLNLEHLSPQGQELPDLASFTDSTFLDFDFTTDGSLLETKQQLPTAHFSDLSLPPSLDLFLSTPAVKQENDQTQRPTTKKQKTSSPPQYSSAEPETDKKKRNTAASARFRIKKKQREQEMERQVKMLSDRINSYNDRINQLETENACLKSLILEKSEKRSDNLLRSIKEKSMMDL